MLDQVVQNLLGLNGIHNCRLDSRVANQLLCGCTIVMYFTQDIIFRREKKIGE